MPITIFNKLKLLNDIIEPGTEARVYGYGHNLNNTIRCNSVHVMNVRIIDNNNCSRLLQYSIHPSEMCGVSMDYTSLNLADVSIFRQFILIDLNPGTSITCNGSFF